MDVMYSDWDCTLEGLPHPSTVRLGLRQVSGPTEESVRRLVEARPFCGPNSRIADSSPPSS